ncbi:putative APC1 protein [Podospora didyma]|uniref:APC1 protein n=1 Tax=Podospora didyma TaxID=330526 RepID=A0AAE0U016_9PEZI|nr:putative APC1 protein [Podospora didyma]
MASITSLGVHQPTALRHAIEEGILPPNPPPSSYTWEITTDNQGNNEGNGKGEGEASCDYEDELLTTQNCVLWSRGGIFRKSYKFDLENDPVTQALLTYFPASADSPDIITEIGQPQKKSADQLPVLSRALVVFLKTQAHIFFLSGTSHVVHMPFEVESACAAPCGVIIQRKSRTNAAAAPVSLRLPKVPPNSFLSLPPASPTSTRNQRVTEFSIEGLGNPKPLPLRLSSTLENMWQTPMETSESHWPRLVCLIDPLLEIGLVVARPDKPRTAGGGPRTSVSNLFLDPAEEILHVQEIQIPYESEEQRGKLNIAVTVNRETSMYSVWRLSYLQNDDPFIGRQKKKAKPVRRRSSMGPGLASGAATPVHPSARDSFGAPLPGKKSRKSVRIEEKDKDKDKDKALDNALSSLDPDKGTDATRRQSRRVSSLLARADLSASQDRSAFAQYPEARETLHQSLRPGAGGRRVESHGSDRRRVSGGHGGASFSGSFNHNLNSLAEAPVDNLLEELRAGGDFEGFHTMGLDDHDFDGLTHEMLFTKIHSITMDNANVRYSLSNKPARTHSRVFVLVGPPTATDERGRAALLVGIQDPVDKRLQLLTLLVEIKDETPKKSSKKKSPLDPSTVNVTFRDLRRVQSVVDSCKVSDGSEETIMILSEDKSGGRGLSLQSPWGPLTTVSLPLLFFDNLNSLDYSGSHQVNKEVRGRRSVGVGVTGTEVDSICHPKSRGVLDLRDTDGKFHRIRIKLRPSSPQVQLVLKVCRSVLAPSHAERLLVGWWHVMRWLEDFTTIGLEHPPTDTEWSALVILLLGSFLALKHASDASLLKCAAGLLPAAATGNWEAMQLHEMPNSSVCPPWMHNKGWSWLLEEGVLDAPERPDAASPKSVSFMSIHISLTKKYMASSNGVSAFGSNGYLPTGLSKDENSRITAAWSIMHALHLLSQEQKLNILSPEDSSPSQADLKGVLCQLAKWLGWQRFAALYAMDTQAELDDTPDSAPLFNISLDEPSADSCVLTWIQEHLTTEHGTDFPTLSQIYTTATRDEHISRPRQNLWNALTPRTLMFSKFFDLLRTTSSPYEMVVAMHTCGFTPQILETLPEAILTPLQDVIFMCQPNPPPNWPKTLLSLVNRTDISTVLQSKKGGRTLGSEIHPPTHIARWDFKMLCRHLDDFHDHIEETNGSERQAVVRSLFREDRRLNEAQNLLSSVKPRVVQLDPKKEWTESEYMDRVKDLVATVATGTLAVPAGRGLLYYSLRYPLLTQKYHISGFNLTCLVKPNNNAVGVDKTLFTEEKINWAFFHQGVAGGLAISPHAKGIDTSWILYNKPGQDLSNRHAGFLLALGLNGHLKSVAKWVAFKYLTPKHTMTSIGLLLGLAASYIGTMDSLITRLLSVHVTRMLPRGAAELNLSKHTQTTGIMGIGLLYCNSQHRRMSEIMMSEIEYIDDGEEEDPLRDEGYRLAAGFALGFINLGKGNDLKGLRDMRLTEKLLTLATSTKRVELVHVLDRSAAGAAVAIALIFMKSEDHIVARKIDVPDTILQFDYVRPDVLLLRTMAKNIILWKEIDPSFEWIQNGLPIEYRTRSRLTSVTKLLSKDLPFFSILAGLCWALGLRFAGSANSQVRDLLIHYLDEFLRIVRIPAVNFDSEMARGNVRMCLDMVALSCATVMAGTGDLIVLRRLRALHGRDDPNTTYGSHLAAHLAIGALFLGCGTATFGTSNLAIAALIVSFYPLFPASVQDNRSHLQAFRHFWVLATDPRCLVAKDLVTNQPLNVPMLIHLKPGSPSAVAATVEAAGAAKRAQTAATAASAFKDSLPDATSASNGLEVTILRRQTPCLLPPLDDVRRVSTDASALGFWNLVIDLEGAPHLVDDFRKNQSVYLRRRPAHESPFPATLRALGTREGAGADLSGRDPMEWIFGLDALSDLTHSERALVLDRLGSGGGIGEGEGASTAVDAKLVLKSGMDGWSRDRLLGLKLLFEWADRRSSLIPQPAALAGGAVVPDETAARGKEEKGKAPASTKKSETGRKTKKVMVQTSSEEMAAAPARDDTDAVSEAEKKHGWWLKDSAIEELKGMAWFVGREG